MENALDFEKIVEIWLERIPVHPRHPGEVSETVCYKTSLCESTMQVVEYLLQVYFSGLIKAYMTEVVVQVFLVEQLSQKKKLLHHATFGYVELLTFSENFNKRTPGSSSGMFCHFLKEWINSSSWIMIKWNPQDYFVFGVLKMNSFALLSLHELVYY